jgi:hypothetical protein
MPKVKILIALSFALIFSLACRAATNLVLPDPGAPPTGEPAVVRPPTATPQAPVEPETAPDSDPERLPAEIIPGDLPGDLDEAFPEMPLIPMGTPFRGDSYKGVPLMPGASNASESAGTLTFTIDQPVAEVVAYYQEAMPKQNWLYLSGSTEAADSAILIYNRGAETATIAILPNIAGEAETMVMVAVP